MGGALGSAALGMVAGTLLLAGVGRAISSRARIVLSLAGAGLALIAFAALSHPAALAGAAFVAGFFVSFLLVTTESVIQASVGIEARARVFALRDFLARAGVLVSAGAIGALLARAWLTPEVAVSAAGAILVVGGLVGAAGWIPANRDNSRAGAS
jgi:MFS family permease